MGKEFRFRKTRKVYSWFYVLCISLVFLYIYLKINSVVVGVPIIVAGCIFILVGLKYSEIDRLHNLYGYNSQYIFHENGILRKDVKKVFLARISDIVLSRSAISRIFNYGSVNIHHFGGTGVIEVKKIDSPHKFVEGLQDMINKSDNQKE